MRARTTASTDPRAAMALARTVGLNASDAKALLAIEQVQPLELNEHQLEALRQAMSPFGVAVTTVDVPMTTLRCGTHPKLTADRSCSECRREICLLCVDGRHVPRCRDCLTASQHRTRWKGRRVAVLSLVLIALTAAGWRQSQRRSRRVAWKRTLEVTVVMHSENQVDDAVVQSWREGLTELEDWFANEMSRLGGPLSHPVRFTLLEGVRSGPRPQQPTATGSSLDDARNAFAFRNRLRGLAPTSGDVQLIVSLGDEVDPARGQVEGVAEGGGDLGLIYASNGKSALGLELTALAHELLHCLGAVDAYEPDGRAQVPEGLAEPDLIPRFPQRFAEVMVGEIPDTANSGHVPSTLSQVRIGPATAKAIGWIH